MVERVATEPSQPQARKWRGLGGFPHPCAVMGCGELAHPGNVYCVDHRRAHRSARRAPEIIGPSEDNDLDIVAVGLSRPIGRGFSTCAFEDCGQPCLAGRLYCSPRCRQRARKEPAEFEIGGVRATLREHAETYGIDLTTVYARMREGYGAVEAVTMPLDGLQHLRRTRRT